MNALKKIILTYAVMQLCLLLSASDSYAQFVLSGTVTDSNSVPISAVEVLLYDDLGSPIGIPFTQTDINGFYSISGLPTGTYGLGFVPSVQGHIGETYTGISVGGNTTYDVMLATGYHLSGYVRDSVGQGIFDIDLNVYDQLTGDKLTTSGDNTDINGFYHITVPPGEYTIRYRAVGLLADPWVPIELYNVTIASDTTIDVELEIGFEVSGTITSSGGGPVFNADLDFFNRSTGTLQVTPSDNTDVLGFYSVILPSGSFDVTVTPQGGDPVVPLEDTAVSITGVTTLNYTLDPGYFISGIVRDPLMVPVQDVDIDIIDAVTGNKLITPGDNTDASGFYQVIVPSGMYDLVYQPQVATGLAPSQFPSVMISTDHTQDVMLVNGLHLSGILQKAVGGFVVNADIDVKDAFTGIKIPVVGDNTDASGAFTVIVEPGTYNIEFEPLASDFLSPVIVKDYVLSQDTLFNITIDTGFVLSGVVTDNNSAVVPQVEVTVLSASSGDTVYTPSNKTDLLGIYSILLPNNDYNISYNTDPLSGYIDSIKILNYAVTSDAILNVSFGSGQPSCCLASRGNVNGDIGDLLDISDLLYLVDYFFAIPAGPAPVCIDEADVNGSGILDISDLLYLVDYFFLAPSGPAPVDCL